jgi:hypothetical protein
MPFDISEYSQFKYGNRRIARKMAEDLSECIVTELSKHSMQHVVVYSSPLDVIPTSSYYLTEYCVDFVRSKIQAECSVSKIKRLTTYADNYGLMSADERLRLISDDTYSFQSMPADNALLLFLDDVSITGTHQRVIEALLEKHQINNTSLFFYYATLVDDSHPSIEEYLNSYQVSDYETLATVVLDKSWGVTTRAVKYILSLSADDLHRFIAIVHAHKPLFASDTLRLAFANSYHTMPEYKSSIEILGQYDLES